VQDCIHRVVLQNVRIKPNSANPSHLTIISISAGFSESLTAVVTISSVLTSVQSALKTWVVLWNRCGIVCVVLWGRIVPIVLRGRIVRGGSVRVRGHSRVGAVREVGTGLRAYSCGKLRGGRSSSQGPVPHSAGYCYRTSQHGLQNSVVSVRAYRFCSDILFRFWTQQVTFSYMSRNFRN
jgi:hypothetical protein